LYGLPLQEHAVVFFYSGVMVREFDYQTSVQAVIEIQF